MQKLRIFTNYQENCKVKGVMDIFSMPELEKEEKGKLVNEKDYVTLTLKGEDMSIPQHFKERKNEMEKWKLPTNKDRVETMYNGKYKLSTVFKKIYYVHKK